MADFKTAFALTSKWEGGYSNRKNDRGKETYRGISRKNWPNWEGWAIIDSIKKHRVIKHGEIIKNTELDKLVERFFIIYFWDKIKGDYIIKQPIANVLFDWSVTSGSHPIKSIQILVGVVPDGIIGPKTLTEINRIEPKGLFELLKDRRRSFYNCIADNDPTQEENRSGWINRTNSFHFE